LLLAGWEVLKDPTGKWSFRHVSPESVEQLRQSFSRILFADGSYEISTLGGAGELFLSFVRNT